jgi:hypothetical protein
MTTESCMAPSRMRPEMAAPARAIRDGASRSMSAVLAALLLAASATMTGCGAQSAPECVQQGGAWVEAQRVHR